MTSPVFIVSAPRSGATALHRLLVDSGFEDGELSHPTLLDIKNAAKDANYSHQLNQDLITKDIENTLDGLVSNLEGTVNYNPRLGLRIDALAKAFPNAKFVFVTRTPAAAIASGIEAWASQNFVTETDLPGWWGEKWSFGLIPGWASLIGKPLGEIVAQQFLKTSELIMDSLQNLATTRWLAISYEDMVLGGEISKQRLSEFLEEEIGFNQLPAGNFVSKPNKDKWRNRLQIVLPALGPRQNELARYNEFRKEITPEDFYQPEQVDNSPQNSRGTAFESSFTSSFVELLSKANASIAITTYKTGQLIFASETNGAIHTNFEPLPRPMGLAFQGNKLAVGLDHTVNSYLNIPQMLSRLQQVQPQPDSAYIPTGVKVTGDVAIHEMEYDRDGELVFVNTKFSCLSRLDENYSFVPIWRPSFISAYAAEDRCHLNGLAMQNGKPKYVTALSQTDSPNGWREHKGTSGVIIDIDTGELVAEGLSMPHSPRIYEGKLFVLQSGKGNISTVDIESGVVTEVCKLPGFTRGLAFLGKYALVGLSQVRESVFSDLPVTDSAEQRNCGVWIVDIEAGELMGFLKFEKAIQEIFDVKVVPNSKTPSIVSDSSLISESYILDENTLKEIKA
jgi:uncharacterized protein (TIGR03032 family)